MAGVADAARGAAEATADLAHAVAHWQEGARTTLLPLQAATSPTGQTRRRFAPTLIDNPARNTRPRRRSPLDRHRRHRTGPRAPRSRPSPQPNSSRRTRRRTAPRPCTSRRSAWRSAPERRCPERSSTATTVRSHRLGLHRAHPPGRPPALPRARRRTRRQRRNGVLLGTHADRATSPTTLEHPRRAGRRDLRAHRRFLNRRRRHSALAWATPRGFENATSGRRPLLIDEFAEPCQDQSRIPARAAVWRTPLCATVPSPHPDGPAQVRHPRLAGDRMGLPRDRHCLGRHVPRRALGNLVVSTGAGSPNNWGRRGVPRDSRQSTPVPGTLLLHRPEAASNRLMSARAL